MRIRFTASRSVAVATICTRPPQLGHCSASTANTRLSGSGYSPDATLHDVLFATPANKAVKGPDPIARGRVNATVSARGESWFVEKALFEEYAQFGRGHHHDPGPFDLYYADDVHGLRWPVIDGKQMRWRFNEQHDPCVARGAGRDFYGAAMKAVPAGDLDDARSAEKAPLRGKAKNFFRDTPRPPRRSDPPPRGRGRGCSRAASFA